jgi:hypothetical protein
MTAIGDGLTLASSSLARQSKSRVSGNQVIVVFTDGENNYGTDPVKAPPPTGARAHIVAVICRGDQEASGGSSVDERRHPARWTLFQRGGCRLAARLVAINSLEKGFVSQTEYIRNQPVYDYFVIPAILLLAGALVLRAVPYFIDLT